MSRDIPVVASAKLGVCTMETDLDVGHTGRWGAATGVARELRRAAV